MGAEALAAAVAEGTRWNSFPGVGEEDVPWRSHLRSLAPSAFDKQKLQHEWPLPVKDMRWNDGPSTSTDVKFPLAHRSSAGLQQGVSRPTRLKRPNSGGRQRPVAMDSLPADAPNELTVAPVVPLCLSGLCADIAEVTTSPGRALNEIVLDNRQRFQTSATQGKASAQSSEGSS